MMVQAETTIFVIAGTKGAFGSLTIGDGTSHFHFIGTELLYIYVWLKG